MLHRVGSTVEEAHINMNIPSYTHMTQKIYEYKQSTHSHWKGTQTRMPTCTNTHPDLSLLFVLESGNHLFDPWLIAIPNVCVCLCACDYSLCYVSCCGPILPPSFPSSLPSPALPRFLSLSMCLCHSGSGTLRAQRSGWSTSWSCWLLAWRGLTLHGAPQAKGCQPKLPLATVTATQQSRADPVWMTTLHV